MTDTREWVDRTAEAGFVVALVLIVVGVLVGILAAPTLVIYWWFDLSGTWPLVIDIVLTLALVSLPVAAAFAGD